MKIAYEGGSSRVFRKALKAEVEARDQHIAQLDVALDELRGANEKQTEQLAQVDRDRVGHDHLPRLGAEQHPPETIPE